MKILVITLVTFTVTLAEPPRNENDRYLPPQNKYLPPQNKYLPSSAPTASKYLPPVGPSPLKSDISPKPNKVYGAPIDSYGVPSGSYGEPSPSYGAPSRSYGAPSRSYGAPSSIYGIPSNIYGVPSTSHVAQISNEQSNSKLSQVYGSPPAQSSNYGVPTEKEGYGGQSSGQSEPANYDFEYHVQDAQSGNDFGHKEQRQGDEAQGKYFVLLPDGRLQTVEYTADEGGYKPKVSYQFVGFSGSGYPGGSGGYQYS